MGVQVASDLLDPDELRQGVRRGRVDLASILTQLGRDPIEAERTIHVLLCLRGDLLPARFRADALEAVFVQQQLPAKREAAEPNVVLFRAGEMEEGEAVGGRGQVPER